MTGHHWRELRPTARRPGGEAGNSGVTLMIVINKKPGDRSDGQMAIYAGGSRP